MESSVTIVKIWGIPIDLHLSWFLVFALITWSLAAGYFPAEYPELTPAVFWFLATVTSVLFFGSYFCTNWAIRYWLCATIFRFTA